MINDPERHLRVATIGASTSDTSYLMELWFSYIHANALLLQSCFDALLFSGSFARNLAMS